VSNRRSVDDRYDATDPLTARILAARADENLWSILRFTVSEKMKKPSCSIAWLLYLAEREGFEPSMGF
jgi:hypothetical protein